MIYSIAKILVRLAAELFFSKHHIQNFKALQTGKPLIVCANHASAHLDGILIMIFSKRKFHVLVRADVFKKKWMANLLGKFNLIPIYRMRDGISNLDKNDETFDRCYEILKNNGAIIIFPEANCVPERSLRKLHKGAAKIGFMAMERSNFTLELDFACVGISQERMTKPGGRLFLTASAPFPMKQYEALYKENQQKAYNQVTAQVEEDLRSVLPVIDRKQDELLFEELLIHSSTRDQFDSWKKIAKNLNQEENELKDFLHTALRDFDEGLAEKGLKIQTIRQYHMVPRWKRWITLLTKTIDLMAMFPFFVLGALFNWWPYFVPKRITERLFKKDLEYRNGTHMVMSLFFFIIAYALYTVILFVAGTHWLSVLVFIGLLMACGLVSYYYRQRAMQFMQLLRYERLGSKAQAAWRSHMFTLQEEFDFWLK